VESQHFAAGRMISAPTVFYRKQFDKLELEGKNDTGHNLDA